MNKKFKEFIITDSKSRTKPSWVQALLTQSYWAADRELDVIRKSIRNSICFSVFRKKALVGFVRVVTDGATFSWIADLIIREDCRGRGLGKELMRIIQEDRRIPGSIQILATRDAHGLYEKYGFKRWEGMRK